jgi:hypothetical protein
VTVAYLKYHFGVCLRDWGKPRRCQWRYPVSPSRFWHGAAEYKDTFTCINGNTSDINSTTLIQGVFKKRPNFCYKDFISQHFKHCPLQSSPLYWLYTVSNVSSIVGMLPGTHFLWWRAVLLSHFPESPRVQKRLNFLNTAPTSKEGALRLLSTPTGRFLQQTVNPKNGLGTCSVQRM